MKDYGINFCLKGSMEIEELNFLQDLASQSSGDILEIGAHQGRTAIAMAEVLDEKYKIYSVDVWQGQQMEENVFLTKEVFLKNVSDAGFSDRVEAIQESSEFLDWAGRGELGMVVIDGCHKYHCVKSDCMFAQYIKSGGILAFHDYISPNYQDTVMRAVDEFVGGTSFKKIGIERSLIAFRNE